MRSAGAACRGFFNAFSYALEIGAGATAVLVALIYNTMGIEVFLLALAVLSVGMLALRQFADMRHKLELIVAERTQKLEEKTRELEVQATRDNLTGLFNRRYADEYLARELESCRRERRHFAVALADIDLFKRVNDLHSHATGDAVLRRVATVLRDRCRTSDVLARYGGEEFLLCFPNTDLREARLICEELRVAVERGNWAQLGLAGGVTISFGIAEYRTDSSPERLLEPRGHAASTRRRTAAAISSSRSARAASHGARYDASRFAGADRCTAPPPFRCSRSRIALHASPQSAQRAARGSRRGSAVSRARVPQRATSRC